MRERGRKNRTSATMLAGWKKAVVLMLALIMCISSIVVPQPEEVSAKAANRIDFKINGKAGSKVTLYAGEYVKFTIDGMWQNGDYIQTSGTNAYGDKINFKPSKELTYKSSNNAVATVTNKGVITAKKKGTCKITVTSIYNAKVKGTIKVTVNKKKQNAKITLEKKKATIAVGKTTTVKVKSYKGISRKGVKFASSNKKVATVSSKGKVTAKKAGISTISTTVMSQAGTIVCSGVLGVNSTAEYGLVLQLITVLVGVGQIIYQIHIPVLTNAKIINDLERQQRKFSLSVVGFFLITIMGMFFCVLFLGDIISLIKSNTVFNNTLFLGVALYYIPENNYSIHASYISIGNELPFVKSLVFTSLLRILLLFLGTYILRLGLWGIVFAGIISDYVYIIWKWPSVALKQLQLTPLQLIKVGFSELYRLFFGGRLQKAKGF